MDKTITDNIYLNNDSGINDNSKESLAENCAVDIVSKITNVSKKEVSIELLKAEIKGKNFNKDSIKNGQIYISGYAIIKVLKSHSISTQGFSLSIKTIAQNLNKGDTTILFVDNNHFILLNKNQKGNFEIYDSNKKNTVTYTEKELKTLLQKQKNPIQNS